MEETHLRRLCTLYAVYEIRDADGTREKADHGDMPILERVEMRAIGTTEL